MKTILNILTLGVYGKWTRYKELEKKASDLSDTYFKYAKLLIEYMDDDMDNYKKYYSLYNQIFTFDYKFSHTSSLEEHIKYFGEKVEQVEQTFIEVPYFKNLNRERVLENLDT